jgi:osmotically inducible protein OsmC
MPQRSADATWTGPLADGNGTMSVESGAYDGAYSFHSRFEDGEASNPEELIAAAHAGCFSMALSNVLDEAGFSPDSVHTSADVTLRMVDGDPTITSILLTTEATVPDIDDATFQEHAAAAKDGCPVSKALAGVEISLDASLA